MSRELILSMSVSVDGFVAGPNGEIDWIFRNTGGDSAGWAADRLAEASLIAMGRRSYEGMADYWPTATGPFARPMNEIPKAVFSRSGAILQPPMEKTAAADPTTVDEAVVGGWRSPILTGTDLTADVQRLKAEDGGPIVAIGGASFASSLLAAHLVDVLRLAVHPELLGRGLPIFAGLEAPVHLELEELKAFDTGAMIKTYRPRYAG